MNKFVFTLLILFSHHFFAQSTKQLIVDYKLFYEYNQTDFDALKKFVPDLKHESGNLLFQLIVQDSCSYFSERNGIKSNELSSKIAMNNVLYNMPIYTNIAEKKMYFNNPTNYIFMSNEVFLIYKNCNFNWNLLNETKLIDGILCYKAKISDYYYLAEVRKEFDVIAWFAPQFKYSFGPTFYHGLPGLILEINYLNSTLVATKINIVDSTKNVKKPTGYKLVNIEEFNLLSKERLIEIKELIKKSEKK